MDLCCFCLFGLPALPVLFYVLTKYISPKPLNLKGSHVLVTGGSSGIGKAIAREVIQKGANVTIIARNLKRLQDAKEELDKCLVDKDRQKVVIISEDISKDAAVVQKAIEQAEENLGPIDLLVNNAGSSINGTFEGTPPSDFRKMIDINYLSSVFVTKAAIKSMKEKQNGRIVFVSSQAGQCGVFGYTAYSPSKFALRGLAEALQMEVKQYNIYVTLAHPPDTDTPGYAEENLTKPRETVLISETSGVFSPESVAKKIVKDAVNGKFISHIGLDGFFIAIITAGMSPVTSVCEIFQQVFLSGLLRLVSIFYLTSFDRIVKKCKEEREQENKKES